MNITIDSIRPVMHFATEEIADSISLYGTQAEMQLLSKLRSQSYRAYIAGLAALPEKEISDKMSLTEIDIDKEEKSLYVSGLLPTQSQVFLDGALPKLTVEQVPDFFKDEVEIKFPIVTFNDHFVIDGHHRWLSIAMLNPNARIKCVNFISRNLTPVQFLKLLQGAIVMEEGELPKLPKNQYKIDIYHASRKKIAEYLSETLSFEILDALRSQLKLESTEEVLTYLEQNAYSIKYNNLPAIGSPSRELMPQTNDRLDVLDIVEEDAPVVTPPTEN